jgi:hypothetical protein
VGMGSHCVAISTKLSAKPMTNMMTMAMMRL